MKTIAKESASQPTIDESGDNSESGRMIVGLIVCFLISLFVSAFLTALIAVPVIGLVPLLLAFPLYWVLPELQSSGQLVEYGFMWVTIKQAWVWLVFFTYFFVVTFLPPSFLIVLLRVLGR